RLAEIRDVELAEVDDDGWKGLRRDLSLLFSAFLSLPGVDLAQCSKVMHLKRPRLIPVMDHFVVKFLTGNDLGRNVFSAEEQHLIGLGCMDIARADLIGNKAAFSELHTRLADLPTPLTSVRLYCILCWTQEKWVNRGDIEGPYGVAGKSLNQSPMPPSAVSGRPAEEAKEPPGEIRNIREFRQVKLRAEGVVVTTGSKPPRAHRALCRELSEERFQEAVVFNEGKKGRYYLRNDLAEAARDFKAVACMKCKPERRMASGD
ncbi:MAG TPA: DUF6308 family protein, partial [Nitrososphaerales archaeon]|nr:DUF6308 family protein [Nitrososphaerales archaeon]